MCVCLLVCLFFWSFCLCVFLLLFPVCPAALLSPHPSPTHPQPTTPHPSHRQHTPQSGSDCIDNQALQAPQGMRRHGKRLELSNNKLLLCSPGQRGGSDHHHCHHATEPRLSHAVAQPCLALTARQGHGRRPGGCTERRDDKQEQLTLAQPTMTTSLLLRSSSPRYVKALAVSGT